jgi:type IV pilus assembly protein PilM
MLRLLHSRISFFALQNIFEVNYDTEDENIALIDIGASKTSLNILKGSSSVFMRDVSLGCGQINQKIISLINCSFEEADEIKFEHQPDKISEEDMKEITSTIVSDWCTEIRRALDFFYSTYPDDQIKRIILSGGGGNIAEFRELLAAEASAAGNIAEFRELLAAEASAAVETINPFGKFSVDASLDPLFIKEIAPQAAICMGLAVRRVDDK